VTKERERSTTQNGTEKGKTAGKFKKHSQNVERFTREGKSVAKSEKNNNQIYAGPAPSMRSPTLAADTLRPSRAFFVKWVGTGATMGGD